MTDQVDPKALEKTVIDLGRRIRSHIKYIAGHETRTRIVLIDPLLRALGWDPENPDAVHLEYRASNGKPDYALMKGDEPVAFVEAKRLGSTLDTHDPGQVIKYTNDPALKRCEVVAFTDGNVWAFFRSSAKWGLETVEISSSQTFKSAYDLVECLSPSKLGVRASLDPENTAANGPDAQGKCYPLIGELPGGTPTSVQIGEASPTEWVSWRGLYVSVAKYVVASGGISLSDLPIWVTRGEKWAINHSPKGPDGTPFNSPALISEGMWLEAHGNPTTHRIYSRRLLKRFHSDPESVVLCFD